MNAIKPSYRDTGSPWLAFVPIGPTWTLVDVEEIQV